MTSRIASLALRSSVPDRKPVTVADQQALRTMLHGRRRPASTTTNAQRLLLLGAAHALLEAYSDSRSEADHDQPIHAGSHHARHI
jgi:hypothetical protein